MNVEDYLDHFDADCDRLATVARRDPDANVPSCPGWTVRDAVVHTGEVFWHKTMSMRLGGRPNSWPEGPDDGGDPIDWFVDAAARLRTELVSRGPAASTWTWWPSDQTVGFWYRRMSQEVAIHRIDVESAFDDVTPLADDFAADGADEVLRLFLDGTGKPPDRASGQRVAIDATERRWVVTLGPDVVRVADEGPAVATVIGTPSDVDLWLWGRVRPDRLTVDGDGTAVDVLREWLVTATQ